MAILVGSTGFVGGHISRSHDFDVRVHRPTIEQIANTYTELLVCAGLPAEKWRANQDPSTDWANMSNLAQVLSTVKADRAVLISTIDVFQPAIGIDEHSPIQFNGAEAYGAHRAWFEAFFTSQFPGSLIMRLPGLFAPDLRKNLIYDLLHGRSGQWSTVNPDSTFQFFDAAKTWMMIEQSWKKGVHLLNVSSEPVTAQEVAGLFGVNLSGDRSAVHYNMRSIHAESFGGRNGYIFSREETLDGIDSLRNARSNA